MADNRIATLETDKGTIRFTLYEDEAPGTAGNFIELAQKGFYDGLNFHRVVPGFVIQGGCPEGTGTGGSGKNIKLEVTPKLKHHDGAVAMARSAHPDSASSQFYITLGPQPSLDMQYAVFGQVTEGQEVAQAIRVGDKIKSVTISEKSA